MLPAFLKKGIFKDLMATLFITLIIYLSLCIIISMQFISSKQDELEAFGHVIVDHITETTNDNISTFNLSHYSLLLSNNSAGRVIIFNPTSKVIYDSHLEDDNLCGTTLKKNDLIQPLLEGKSIRVTRSNTCIGTDYWLIVGIPIKSNGDILGGLLVSMPLSSLFSYFLAVYMIALIGVFLILFLLVYSTLYYQRKTTNSLEIINAVSKDIADGNLASRVNIRKVALGFQELGKNMNYMAAELEKTEDMRRNFIANVSHDFRSPLTSIKGFVQAIQDGTIPVENQKKYLDIVLDEANRLTELTNSILLLTKMESVATTLEKNSFEIHHVIRKVLLQFENQIKDKNLLISFEMASPDLFVYADLNQIQRVLYNLIDNAIKFCNPHDAISIHTNIEKGKVKISVIDTGKGIEQENLKYIWKRFNKVDTSRGEDKKGIGIGLSIVKEILLAHNESITVTSKKGVGTSFTFTLPLSNEHL
jgi:signal transduction histidine kinase